MLHEVQEKVLIQEYLENKNSYALERLIYGHEGYIWKLVNQYFKAFKEDVPIEDLYQSAILGFIQGIQKYDIKKSVKLLSFIHWDIVSAMFDTYCKNLPVHIPNNIARNFVWNTDKAKEEEINKLYKEIMKPIQLQRTFDSSQSDDVSIKNHNIYDSTYEEFQQNYLPNNVWGAIDTLPKNEKIAFLLRSGILTNGDKYNLKEISYKLQKPEKEIELLLKRAKEKLKRNSQIREFLIK